MYFSANQ